MRNALYATSGLALAGATAVGSASAADMLSVGVGGYMQQWFGMSSVDDSAETVRDGTAQHSDSEIIFKGKLESDNGLTFSVKVELEGNSQDTGSKDGTGSHNHSTSYIDESQLTVSGAFGQVTLGAEDPASTLMHHGGLDVGVTLNCGDTHHWINGLAGCSHDGFGTYGHGHGDRNNISYFTPRVSGVQFGATYIPNDGQEGRFASSLNDNEKDGWAVGANYVGEFGGANVAFSLGHYQVSQTGMQEFISGAKPAPGGRDKRITKGKLAADEEAWETLEYATQNDKKNKLTGLTGGDPATQAGNFATIVNNGLMARQNIMDATDGSMMKADSNTFSNAALQVGFGSFSFGVVYATNDGGAYTTMTDYMVVNANDEDDSDVLALLNEGDLGYSDTDGTVNTTAIDANTNNYHYKVGEGSGAEYVLETDANNDPNNDIVMEKVVKDMSKDWDTWGASVKYSEGPMAVSLSHLATEWNNGDEQDATMLSMSYTLAPGVASKTSIVSAERAYNSGRTIDGTAFVTGFALSF